MFCEKLFRNRAITGFSWWSVGKTLSAAKDEQFGSMPVLEEAKTMVYVTNHNMITIAMVIFKTYKMADKREERKEY